MGSVHRSGQRPRQVTAEGPPGHVVTLTEQSGQWAGQWVGLCSCGWRDVSVTREWAEREVADHFDGR